MGEPLTVVLAGAPMAKERVRVTREGHAYTPERTLNYEARLARAAQVEMAGRSLFDGPLKVLVEARMPIPESKPKRWKEAARAGQVRPTKKPDWDNFGKILDALNLIVWADDAQIVEGRVLKFYSDRPELRVTVETINEKEGIFG